MTLIVYIFYLHNVYSILKLTKLNFEEILNVLIYSGCHDTYKQKYGLLAWDCLICQSE